MTTPQSSKGRILLPVVVIAAAISLLVLYVGTLSSGTSAPYFVDVTPASGLETRGMTFGAAWGDYDADGLPDVYLANHLNRGRMFRNAGQGRFVDVTDGTLPTEPPRADKHGAQWADFDNDGDLDLVVLRGGGRGVGREANLLYVNENGTFSEQADALGLANPQSRTRMPLWVDADRDGRLDLFMGAFRRGDGRSPASIFVQGDAGFSERRGVVPFGSQSATFCVLSDVDRDRAADLVCRVYEVRGQTAQIFSTAGMPLRELPSFPGTHFEDVASADFDGDGQLDLYLARRGVAPPVVVGQRGSNELVADVRITDENVRDELGFAFAAGNELEFTVSDEHPGDAITPRQIRIGADTTSPSSMSFLVNSETAGIGSLPTAGSGDASGIGLGLSPDGTWIARVSGDAELIAADSEKHQRVAVRVLGSDVIKNPQVLGEQADVAAAPDRLYINKPDGWSEQSADRGVNDPPVDAVNVVAGDFDNDMDVDLYLVSSSIVANSENRLLLNRGDGTFVVADNAGGATGGRRGVGDSATIADFDRDGFLDLLVANGGSMDRSFGLAARGGDYRLYRNVGNGNHWLQIDLQGTSANRDGIGAFVYVTAGRKRQVRVQDGGLHHRGQNHQRLHFGLASNDKVDEIEVHWPGGDIQRLQDIAADQVLVIREP